MAFDKEEIEGIMQVSAVIKPKIPVAWGWLSVYLLFGVYACAFDSFLFLLAMIRYVFG